MLFRLATGPYDRTPPEWGTVKLNQANEDRVVVDLTGFYDADSDIVSN